MTEKEKMLAGKIYDSTDAELSALSRRAEELCKLYNDTIPSDSEKRRAILDELLPFKKEGMFSIRGPIYFDYGVFTKIGKNFYANYNLTILDVCPVTIGDNVFFGPNVSILTPKHPLMYQERCPYVTEDGRIKCKEYGAPVTIGDNCWIAGNVTILAGAVIGSGCVIGAGSVVAGKIPDNSLAYGNPARVVRTITEADALKYKQELIN